MNRGGRLGWAALAVAAGLLGGCGQGPKLAPVKGKVTIGGKPAAGVSVQFIPDTKKGTKGPTASAQTDGQGEFTLRTGGEEGAVVGHFKVTVTGYPGSRTIPPHYGDPARTPLGMEIPGDGRENVHLQLKSE